MKNRELFLKDFKLVMCIVAVIAVCVVLLLLGMYRTAVVELENEAGKNVWQNQVYARQMCTQDGEDGYVVCVTYKKVAEVPREQQSAAMTLQQNDIVEMRHV